MFRVAITFVTDEDNSLGVFVPDILVYDVTDCAGFGEVFIDSVFKDDVCVDVVVVVRVVVGVSCTTWLDTVLVLDVWECNDDSRITKNVR